jgi:AbrB family looped-hinge helix DNA binding protein
MLAVKILPKGQITLPQKIRKTMNIKEGDTLLVEKAEGAIILRKGKTIFDYARTLPKLKLTIDQMRDKAIEEAVKDYA